VLKNIEKLDILLSPIKDVYTYINNNTTHNWIHITIINCAAEFKSDHSQSSGDTCINCEPQACYFSNDRKMCSVTFDADVVAPPKHLDAPFFEEVLETALRTARVKLLSIHIRIGSSTGENYCSQIYRAKVSFKRPDHPEQDIVFIVKSIPHLDSVEFINDLQVYLKEKMTYYEVLPRLELMMQCKRRFGPK